MALFNKMDKSIFLKEESELKYYILKLQELYSRAEGDLKYKVEKELKIASLGELGEKNIAFELKNSNMPMYVLHDINLEIDGLSAQIDYIVVTRKITFIIECKNLVGNIEIDSQGNFIRTYNFNGRFIKEGIYSPITQNQRHLDILKRLGKANKSNIVTKMLFEKFFDDSYKSIVVLANPKTFLNYKYAKKEAIDKVIRADQLIDYIKRTNEKSDSASFDDESLKKQAEKILSWHKSDKMSYLNKYQSLLEEFNSNNTKDIVLENISSDKVDSRISLSDINVKKIHYKDINNNEDANIRNDNIDNEELIKKLKSFRIQASRAENYKPYFIFNDKQMMALIDKMPKNKDELRQVSGFGEIKVEKYGDHILKIINE